MNPASGAAVLLRQLAPQTGTAFALAAGRSLLVSSPQGSQVSDLCCFNATDHGECLSGGRTIDLAGTIYLTTGHQLFSNRGRPMLTITEDSCGRHDILVAPCSQEMFDLLYPELGGASHPSCFENLCRALAEHGIDPGQISTSLNIFMNVRIGAAGDLHVDPPRSVAGDRFVVRAELDLLVGLTACSAEKSNDGVCKPIAYGIEDAAGISG